MSNEDWITTHDAAKLTGYDREYIRRLVRSKRVEARKFGTVWQVSQKSLTRYLQESEKSSDGRRGPKPEN